MLAAMIVVAVTGYQRYQQREMAEEIAGTEEAFCKMMNESLSK